MCLTISAKFLASVDKDEPLCQVLFKILTLRSTRSNKTSHKHGEYFVPVTTGTRVLYHLLIVCSDSSSYSSDLHVMGHEILIPDAWEHLKQRWSASRTVFPTVWSHRVLGLPENPFQRLTRILILCESRTPSPLIVACEPLICYTELQLLSRSH